MRRQCLSQHLMLVSFFQTIKESLWNAAKTDLRTREGTGKYRPHLVLAAPIDSMENRGLKIVMKSGGKIISSRELMINCTGHAINNRHLPGRFNADIRI